MKEHERLCMVGIDDQPDGGLSLTGVSDDLADGSEAWGRPSVGQIDGLPATHVIPGVFLVPLAKHRVITLAARDANIVVHGVESGLGQRCWIAIVLGLHRAEGIDERVDRQQRGRAIAQALPAIVRLEG